MPQPLSALSVNGSNPIGATDSPHHTVQPEALIDQCLEKQCGIVECLQSGSGLIDTLLHEVSWPESRYYRKGLCSMHLDNHTEGLRTLVLKFRAADGSSLDIPITEIKSESFGVDESIGAIESLHRALEVHQTYEKTRLTVPLLVGHQSNRIRAAATLRQWAIEHIQLNPSLSQTDLEQFLIEIISPEVFRTLGAALCQSLSRSIRDYCEQFQANTGHLPCPQKEVEARIKLNNQGVGKIKWGWQKKRFDFALGSRANTLHQTPNNRGAEPLEIADDEPQQLKHAIEQGLASQDTTVDHLIEWGKTLLPQLAPGQGAWQGAWQGVEERDCQEQLHALTLEFALKAVSKQAGVSIQRLRHAIIQWDHKAWLRSINTDAVVQSPLEHAKWTVLTLLAKTPRGLEACKDQWGPQWDITERQKELLEVLSICAERIELPNGQTPTLANLLHHSAQNEGVLEHACMDAVAELQYQPELDDMAQRQKELKDKAQKYAWAVNAVRNGLYSTEKYSDFDVIANRLEKSKVWMDRAVTRNRLKDMLKPYRGKTPFRALRMSHRISPPTGIASTSTAPHGTGPDGVAPTHKPTSREDFVSGLEHAVDQLQGASRLKLSGGRLAGMGTKGISGTISQLLSGFILRIRGDVRMAKQKTANLELALPAYDLELMLYSQTSMTGQAGGGVAVGPALGFVQLSAGADVVAYNRESSQAQGVALRIPRVRGQENAMKESMKSILKEVLCETTDPDPQLRLKNLLGNYANLTVARIGDLSEKKTQHEWVLEAGVAVDAGIVKASALAGTGLEYQSSQNKHFKDGNGAMQVQRHFGGQALRGHAGAKLNLGYGAWSGAFKLNGVTLEALAYSKDFMNAGRRIRHEVVRNRQRLSPASFYEVEHSTLDDFTQSIMENLNVWVDAKAESLGKAQEEAKSLILDFLNSLSDSHSSNYSYAQRFELKPACAEQLDQLETLLMLSKSMKEARFVRYCESLSQQIQATLMSPDSYAPSSFRVFDRDEKTQLKGPHLSLRLQKLKQTEGVYVANRLM